MALTNPCFKDQFGLKLGRTRREERRGEEEEEEEKWEEPRSKLQKGMDACLCYEVCDFYMVCMEFLSNCMVRRLLQT